MAFKNAKKTLGTLLVTGGIIVGIGLCAALGYHAFTTPITYQVIEENTSETLPSTAVAKKEYFSIDGKVWYTWEKEIARRGTTYCALLDENGLFFDNPKRNTLISITVQKNQTRPENIMPGQELYIPVKVDPKDVPKDKYNSRLEELVDSN